MTNFGSTVFGRGLLLALLLAAAGDCVWGQTDGAPAAQSQAAGQPASESQASGSQTPAAHADAPAPVSEGGIIHGVVKSGNMPIPGAVVVISANSSSSPSSSSSSPSSSPAPSSSSTATSSA